MRSSGGANHPVLESAMRLAEGFARTLGKSCEVVLHDLRDPKSSIIFIANGEITGRELGGPTTDLALRVLRRGGCPDDMMVNYETKTRDGKRLRSTTVFLRDEHGSIIGCLCLNFDLTPYLIAKQLLDEFCTIQEPEKSRESFVRTVGEIVQETVRAAIAEVNRPIPLMNKEDKLQVVQILDTAGVFLIKGAVDWIASELGVSRYTIYNYLEEVRSKSKLGGSEII